MELCCEKTDSQNLGHACYFVILMYVCESCQVKPIAYSKEKKNLGFFCACEQKMISGQFNIRK